MKKLTVTLAAVATLLVFGSPLFAGSGKSLYSPQEMREQASGMKKTVYKQESESESAKRLLGMSVVNNEGEKIGEISDIKMDTELGRINYVIVLQHGEGGKELAVPLQACMIKPGEDQVTLAASEETLETSPVKSSNVSDEDFFYQLQGHYGVNQAWQITPRKNK